MYGRHKCYNTFVRYFQTTGDPVKASERIMESGSVGITTVIPSRGPPGGSPGRYYVKVVADEESLGETAACLPVYCRAFSFSLSLFLSHLPDSNDGLHARWRREYYLYRHITRSIETEILLNLADLTNTGLENDCFKVHENWQFGRDQRIVYL